MGPIIPRKVIQRGRANGANPPPAAGTPGTATERPPRTPRARRTTNSRPAPGATARRGRRGNPLPRNILPPGWSTPRWIQRGATRRVRIPRQIVAARRASIANRRRTPTASTIAGNPIPRTPGDSLRTGLGQEGDAVGTNPLPDDNATEPLPMPELSQQQQQQELNVGNQE